MKIKQNICIVSFIILPSVTFNMVSAKNQPPENIIEFSGHSVRSNRVIVRFNNNQQQPLSSLSQQTALFSKLGLKKKETIKFNKAVSSLTAATNQDLVFTVFTLDGSSDLKTVLKQLNDLPLIQYAEPDYIRRTNIQPNDARFPELWGLNNSGQEGGLIDADIDTPEAWNTTTGSDNIIVGVIDTGVDYNHEDLAANMWVNPGEIPNDGIDNDGNGYIDDIHGIDCVNKDSDPMDDQSHGTHVAGTIGADGNNGVGVTGVNWNTKIMALKILDNNGNGSIIDQLECLAYAVNMKQNYSINIQITNNSYGGAPFSQAEKDAIQASADANMLLIAAAGNDGVNTDISKSYPASYDIENIISVAATNRSDELASFSNYGSTSVDMGAPGVDILSTTPGNQYKFLQGTSMASPHVAGAAALLWSNHPSFTASEIKNKLMFLADPVPALVGKTVSGRRLNINTALNCIPGAPALEILTPSNQFNLQLGNVTVSAYLNDCAEPITNINVVAAPENGDDSFILLDNGQNEDAKANDGIYTGTWQLQNPVEATTLRVNADSLALSASVTGNVIKNYKLDSDHPFQWIDTTSGTRLGISDTDDGNESIAIGFNFEFYGVSYSGVQINSNGLLIFEGNEKQNYENQIIPHTSIPNGFIAPYWDDINPSASDTANIFSLLEGTTPNRRLTIAWVKTPLYQGASVDSPVTFEVTLYEGSNEIIFQYDGAYLADSATIGVEHSSGNVGIQYLHNGINDGQAVQVRDQQAIRFHILDDTPLDTVAPSVPTGLTQDNATATSVSINWSASTDDQGIVANYRVFRDAVAIGTSTTTAYTDDTVQAEQSYLYTVLAIDDSGNESSQSTPLSVNTPVIIIPDTTPPTIPTDLTLTNATATSVNINWTASTDDQGIVASYRVFRDAVAVGTSTTTAYTDDTVQAEQNYLYTVSAIDDSGNESSQSTALSVDTPVIVVSDTTPPTEPTGLTLSNATGTSVSINWIASTDTQGTVVLYHILRDGREIGTSAVAAYTDNTVASETTYVYTVTAEDNAGNASVASAGLSIDTPVVVPPTPDDPQLIAGYPFEEGSGSTILDLSGNGNNGTLAGGAARNLSGETGEAIEFNGSNSAINLGTLDITTPTMSIALWFKPDDFGTSDARLISKANGTAGSAHYWMISTISQSGQNKLRFRLKTENGGTSTLIGNAELIPNVWTHVTATYDGVTMKLFQNSIHVGSLAKTGTISTSSSVEAWIGANPGNTRYFDGLIDDVRIYGEALNGATIQDIVTGGLPLIDGGDNIPDTESPTAPGNLTAQSGTTQVDLNWDAATDNVAMALYRVSIDGIETGTTVTTSFQASGLNSEQSYDFSVVAEDTSGNRSTPAAVTATTLVASDTVAPSVPTGLTLDSATANVVRLSWTASTDDQGMVVSYHVFRDAVEVGISTTASFTDNTVQPDQNYLYTVSATDDSNNESVISAALSVTTPPEATGSFELIAGYPFEEGSGSTILDLSANGNNGTLAGGAARNLSGETGEAIEFNGSNSAINLGTLDITTPTMSIALWFKADDFGTHDARLISKSTGSAESAHYWMVSTIRSDGQQKLRFRLKTSNGGTSTLIGSTTLTTGAWTHVTATYDGVHMKLFQDGVEVGSLTKSGTISTSTSVETWIGANPGNTRFFDGLIDDVRIYNEALDLLTIEDIMQGNLPLTL